MALFNRALIIVLGGGDLASGAIYRLHRAGFPVVVTELPAPVLVRRAVTYGSAVFENEITVEGVTARLVAELKDVQRTLDRGEVPVVVDAAGVVIDPLNPAAVVDGRMAKVNLGVSIETAPLVVALGPGFTAGVDCDAIVETNRGHDLGRVIWHGTAEPDTGIPGGVKGQTTTRVLRAPAGGHVQAHFAIGDSVHEGDCIAEVDGHAVVAQFDGVLRGIVHERVQVTAGMKIGDLDPRARRENCFTISDKSLSVGGGVLEAVMSAPQIRPFLATSNEVTTSV